MYVNMYTRLHTHWPWSFKCKTENAAYGDFTIWIFKRFVENLLSQGLNIHPHYPLWTIINPGGVL